MYAIVQSGSQQFKVAKGDVITVAKLAGEAGEKVVFDRVLFVADGAKFRLGTPLVEGAKVEGTIVGQKRGEKVVAFRYRRRKNSQRIRGSRASLTDVKVTAIA